MQNRWRTSRWSYVSHAALGLDCATQNKHSSLDEARTGVCNTRYGGLMEVATCKWSVYVQYAMHDILILEQGDEVGVQSFGRLRLVGWPPQARLSLSIWKVSLRAGPSFKPMYFIIMSLRSNRRAFPSISCSREIEGKLKDFFLAKLSTKLNTNQCLV